MLVGEHTSKASLQQATGALSGFGVHCRPGMRHSNAPLLLVTTAAGAPPLPDGVTALAVCGLSNILVTAHG